MEKKDLLEIWGFLEVLKMDYEKRLNENRYNYDEVRASDRKHLDRLIELQRLITEETERE